MTVSMFFLLDTAMVRFLAIFKGGLVFETHRAFVNFM